MNPDSVFRRALYTPPSALGEVETCQ